MKLFWKLYYKFKQPKSNFEYIVSYCRMNDIPIGEIPLNKRVKVDDFKGNVNYNSEYYH